MVTNGRFHTRVGRADGTALHDRGEREIDRIPARKTSGVLGVRDGQLACGTVDRDRFRLNYDERRKQLRRHYRKIHRSRIGTLFRDGEVTHERRYGSSTPHTRELSRRPRTYRLRLGDCRMIREPIDKRGHTIERLRLRYRRKPFGKHHARLTELQQLIFDVPHRKLTFHS